MLSFDQYLAIDYGSTFLKGVLFKKVLGKITILRTETLSVVELDENEGDPFEYNIVRFIQSFFPEETNFLINLGIQNLFVRDLSIPLITEKAIKEVLPFEVENLVPYPMEELEVIGKTWRIGKEASEVISFNVHHSELNRALKPFIKGDLHLNCLSLDSFVLSSLVSKNYNILIKEKSILQLDIGGKYSIFNILHEGKLRHTRQIYMGGEEITEEIVRVLKVDSPRAEEIKHSIDFSIFSDLASEAESRFLTKFSISPVAYKSIKKFIQTKFESIIHEMENSIFSLPENERPELLLLSGGGSIFLDLTELMQSRLGIAVSRYEFLGIDDPTLVTAIATGVHYESRNQVDFLGTGFAKRINTNSFRLSAFKPHLVLISISLLLLLGVFIIGIILDNRKIAANKKILTEKYKIGIGGEISEDEDPLMTAASKLKAEKKKTEIYRLFLSQESILDLLNEATEQFPSSEVLPFVLDQFNFDENEIQIYGRVNEFGEIGIIQAALEKSEKFTNIQVLNKRLITGVNKYKVSFKIKMDIVIPKDEP
ncbi:ATPase [Leptospira kobayashii]|uniref:ATPase n=1 Tax=Leptospira kobayashii TaxID=1917830 RepID=A0ABN6KJ44_9LEPT|nr:cell division FtsA domain-containing protein [Leptospira kobayashii]BDA78900.1 ATPase [Leptospira kobayashii]